MGTNPGCYGSAIDSNGITTILLNNDRTATTWFIGYLGIELTMWIEVCFYTPHLGDDM